MKNWLIFLFFLSSAKSFSQNYIEYQKIFNRIDNDVFAKDFKTATGRLDSIYNHYDFIYAKHCIKALQVLVIANDSIRAGKWLEKCASQGVPFWIIQSNNITKKALSYTTMTDVQKRYANICLLHSTSVNARLAKQIDSLLEVDQKYTDRINNGFWPLRMTIYNWQWKRNNRKHAAILKEITEKYGFPGERLLGLPAIFGDSIAYNKELAFYGPNLFDRRAVTMLIHYFSSRREDMNELLRKNVESGYLPAEHYAILNDFLGENSGKKYNSNYYNTWHFDPDGNLESVEKRRTEIGLNTFKRQEENRILNRERRKNKTANSEIITE